MNKIEVENCSSLESPFTPDSHQSDPVGYVDVKVEDETEDESINGSPTMDMEHRTEVSYEELTEWCTIHYYEMNCRYGDPFQGMVFEFSPIVEKISRGGDTVIRGSAKMLSKFCSHCFFF